MSLEACPGVSRRRAAGMLPRVPRPAAGVLTDLAVVQAAAEGGKSVRIPETPRRMRWRISRVRLMVQQT